MSEDSVETEKPKIKHLVIAGGGTVGLTAYGALKRLAEQGVWHIDNIETIYGTSVGAIIGVLLALKFDWTTCDNYIIKRPWDNTFKLNLNTIYNSFANCGMYDVHSFEKIYVPLFNALDISINITMREFFELTKIDVHLFTVELYDFALVDISYHTHPDWRVVDAVYASSCLPIIFQPFKKDAKCYVDGGILCNYPLVNCIASLGEMGDIREILGIRRKSSDNKEVLSDTSNLSDYLMFVLFKIIHSKKIEDAPKIEREIRLNTDPVSLYNIYLFSTSAHDRERFMREGYETISELESSGLGDTLFRD